MSIQRVFRGPLRSNFVLGALLAPAVACSGSNQASSNMVGNGSPSDSGGGADAASTPVILPVEQPEASSTPEAAGPAACVAPDLACDAGCLTNDTLNCGACGNACPAADGGAATCTASNGIYACGVSCDSGFASCGGACVPAATFQTDANNCGSCGHGCIGGTCIGGACQPWLVASNVFVASDNYANNQPPPFATDGVKVAYVMSGGQDGFSDVEVPLAGGTPDFGELAPHLPPR